MPKTNPIRVAVVDDNPEVLDYLKELINQEPDFECINVYKNAEEAEVFLPNTQARLIVVDIGLPGASGIELVRKMKEFFDQKASNDPNAIRVLFMMYTVFEKPDTIFESIKSGATGYILKSDRDEQIINALRDLLRGGAPMSLSVARQVLQFITNPPSPSPQIAELSEREQEVLRCIAQGKSNREIADELGIIEGTVKLHCNSIYRKLHVRNRLKAATIWLESN
jgi:DNA-binding NarL/FixJ family response regulator